MNLFKLILSFFGIFLILAFIAPSNPMAIEKISNEKFSKFLEMFPETELPFSITNDDLNKRTTDENFKSVEATFYETLPQWKPHKFSRIPGPIISPVQSFKKDKLIAVIYSTHNAFTTTFLSFYCSTFCPNGEFLETFELGTSNSEWNTTFTIDKNLIVEKITYENIWKKCTLEYGVKGNEVVKRKKSNIQFFQIDKNGNLEKLKEYKTTSRASLD